MISRLSLTILILLSPACGKLPTEEAPSTEIERTTCTPSFRKLSDNEIHADIDVWQIYFSAILIGCEESLKSVTPEELSTIATDFETYSELPVISLFSEATWPKTRAVAKERANTLLGRSIVTDVFIYSVTIIDHNIMTIDDHDM